VTRLLLTVVLIVLAGAAAIAANLALLGYGSSSNEPVGKFRPVVHYPAAPADVVPPMRGPVENEGFDD
jgi:type IV secretory pathway protease TraF